MTDLGNEDLLCELCAAADFVGAETDYSRDLLAQRCPASADKIFRVYNGLELEKFGRMSETPRTPGPIRLLSVGRLVEFKGFDVLIDACAELRRSGVEFNCEIIGDGPLRADLEARVATNDLARSVRFSGEQSQGYVLQALAACDIFVLAALVDSRGASDVFPTVIAEAMTSGKPVVSTTVAGIPELVVDNQTGLLVSRRNAGEIAAAIARLAGDEGLRLSFGRAGRERIDQEFTIENTIEPLLQRFARSNTAAAGRA